MKLSWLRIEMPTLAGAVITLAILIALQILFGEVRLRGDFTEDRIYTLSDGTRNMVADLQRDVTLKLFFTDGAQVPVALKQYANRVADLLREYVTHSGGRISFEMLDPQPDSDEEEWAQRYGLSGQSLGMMGMGPNLYFGLVGVSGARDGAIPFLSPEAEPQLEYLVTRLIAAVTRTDTPRLGVLSALPIMGSPRNPYGMPVGDESPPWAIVDELEKQYELVRVDPGADSLPGRLDALLIVHPRDIEEDMLFAIDQYLLGGGRVVAFIDPLCISDEQSGSSPFGGAMPGASDLERLASAWGVRLQPGRVAADLQASSQVSFGTQGSERMPTWLSLRPANLNTEDMATGTLDSLMMPFAGAFEGEPAEGLSLVELVYTSSEAKLTDAFLAAQAGVDKMRSATSAGKLPLAVRLQGRFPTAFPNGPPAAATNETAGAKYLSEATADGAAVLVADVDMLANRFSLSEMNFFGQSVFQPVNDNLNFAINLVEQMTGNDALIGLRSRGTFDRPFHRVIELERQAQERWQAEEIKLTERLQQAQARLNELQRNKDADQQYILSPEQKREIDNFREQRFETQRQLKEVRKNLRADIERLGLTLKAVNMGLVPALVAIFGIVHGVLRRSRSN